MTRFALCCVIMMLSVMTACAAPAAIPTPTVIPTELPTSTPVPPTATSIPTITHTPVPPTETPELTATPRPTDTPAPTSTPTKAATKAPVSTPKPATTQSVVAPGGVVSSRPSTLQKSIVQSFSAAQGIIGLLDQMLNGGGGELCAPLLEKYNSIQMAPTYDVSGQSAQLQQAYVLYRQGIDMLAGRAASFQGCGQGGGPLGGLDLNVTHQTTAQVVDTFSKAVELTKYAPGTSHSPLEIAIVQARNAIEDIGGFLDEKVLSPYASDGGVRAKDAPCGQLLADQAVYDNALEMDVSAQPVNVQTAYQLYRQAVDQYRTRISIGQYCASGENLMKAWGAQQIREDIRNIGSRLTEALNVLAAP